MLAKRLDSSMNCFTVNRVYPCERAGTNHLLVKDDKGVLTTSHESYWEVLKGKIATTVTTVTTSSPDLYKNGCYQNKEKEMNTERQWSFTLSSPTALDESLIQEDMSYKNPLAIIKVAGRDEVTILVHNSIFYKAQHILRGRELIEELRISIGKIKISSGGVEYVREIIRTIKAAAYKPEFQDKRKYTVSLLEV